MGVGNTGRNFLSVSSNITADPRKIWWEIVDWIYPAQDRTSGGLL
jgi:hypothetical protein